MAVAPRYFEDVSEADSLPSLHTGTVTSVHLMRWSAAIEAWHKVHYDQKFTTEHDRLPDLLINGSFKEQLMRRMLSDWAGPTGWVWKVRMQFRAMNFVGEDLEVWGRVRRKQALAGFGIVEVEAGVVNAAGVQSSPSVAMIALPFRSGAAVPYPFVPPSDFSMEARS